MKTTSWIRRWFGYTRSERIGTLILCIILMIVIVIRSISLGADTEHSVYPGEMTDKEADAGFNAVDETIQDGASDSVVLYSHGKVLPGAASRTEAGRHFLSQEDEPGEISSEVKNISLNQADSAQFERLKGIGPVLASRIVKFRDLLGGFYSYNQLQEVYGLPSEVISQNRDYIEVDSMNLRLIDINRATFKQLLRHPYIDIQQVKDLIDYRETAGFFTSLEQLIQNKIFTADELEIIRPYLFIDTLKNIDK